MLKCRNVLVVALALCIAASSNAQIRKVKGGYLMRVKFVKGQVIHYGLDSQVSTPQTSTPINATGPMTLKVLAVKGDVGTLDITSGPMSVNGSVVAQAKTARVEEDSRANVVGGVSHQQVGMVFPKGPVKPGQTWDGQASLPSSTGAMSKVNAHYRFIGLKSMNGKRAAQVSTSFEVTSPIQAVGHGSIYFLVSDGSMLRTDLTLKSTSASNSGVMGAGMNVHVVIARH